MDESENNLSFTAEEIHEAIPHNIDFLQSFGLSPYEIYEQFIDEHDEYWGIVIWGGRMFTDESDGYWNMVETGIRGKDL